MQETVPDVVVATLDGETAAEILSEEALTFVADLHRRFDERRLRLLAARKERRARLEAGASLGFLPETASVRDSDWKVAAIPEGLRDRRVEITGPVERKMMINALNSGARVFMADFEDSHSPTWRATLEGQNNLKDAVRGTITYTHPVRKTVYSLADPTATLFVRPRGWHLDEAHVAIAGAKVSASLFDAGLFLFHNAKVMMERGTGPYLYLPKLEHHEEASLWNDVLDHSERALGLEPAAIKCTVLIETLPAAFQMHEILHALRTRITALNAGRWDYIFSCIKSLGHDAARVLPDRSQVTMSVPFMRAYSKRLVAACHRRGALALGGMSAFIPSRKDPTVNAKALAEVRADKEREATDGCDGTWVAHPDLVGVAMEVFDRALGEKPNQVDSSPTSDAGDLDLLDFAIEGGRVTSAGLRNNLEVATRYVAAWLSGNGAVAINNLMEDAATAEIARAQVWQWLRHSVTLDDTAEPVTAKLVRSVLDEVVGTMVGPESGAVPQTLAARGLVERMVLAPPLADFLTIPAYEILTKETRK